MVEGDRRRNIAAGAAMIVALALLSNYDSNKPQGLEAQINPIPTPPTEISNTNPTVPVRQINATPTPEPVPTPRPNK